MKWKRQRDSRHHFAQPAQVRVLTNAPSMPDRPVPIRFWKNVPTAWIAVTLYEGINRQVRRMTAAVGHPTLRLIRIAFGPMTFGTLQPGKWRALTPEEITEILWHAG
jgi:23S rRNA pseudouridine2457 synthase